MSDWATTAIAASAALAGTALSAIVAAHSARRHLAAQDRIGLAAALQAYGYAITSLGLEIDQLPPAPSRAVAALSSATARAPLLDWTLGQVSRRIIGRPATRALDSYNAAMNRLLLVAPQTILTHMKTINDLVVRADDRRDPWAEEWSSACTAFRDASRFAVRAPPPWWHRTAPGRWRERRARRLARRTQLPRATDLG